MSKRTPKYSITVPVFNRPQELEELLESLTKQSFDNFEVLVIEDGSTVPSNQIVENYKNRLRVSYYVKPNSGPGPTRNFGFEIAQGEYLVSFDSDCIIPPGYFQSVESFLNTHAVDAWGGPDAGHASFTPLQQAMAYTMSSVLTTAGIRGKKTGLGTFQPRSFNMGLRRDVFRKTGGFRFDRSAEDIELSVRMRSEGLNVFLIEDAFVYHKRRATLRQFFKQVQNFGKGRVLVGRLHKGAVRIAHWLPLGFVLGLVATIFSLASIPKLGVLFAFVYLAYFAALMVDAFRHSGSLQVAVLVVPSALVQLTGYAIGFAGEWVRQTKPATTATENQP